MLLYAVVKLFAYSLWSYVGLALLVDRRNLARALKLGAFRWVLGLTFGLAAAIALGSIASESVSTLYFGVYGPLRVIEWSILAVVIARTSTTSRSIAGRPVTWLWILGGIAVSFATDLASPEGAAGRFCVGRCLC